MLKILNKTANWPFLLFLGYLIINLFLIVQTILDPGFSGKIPWLTLLWTFILAGFYWKAHYLDWPKSGLITVGIIILGIVVLYVTIVLLPANGFIARLIKVALVVLGSIILLPLSYHFGRNYQRKHTDKYRPQASMSDATRLQFSRVKILLLWIAFVCLLISFFVIPIFSRTDIIGWDSPTHLFRTRLFDTFTINEYTEYTGGYQITFRILSTVIHQVTGIDYLDIVRILPAVMIVAISLAAGYFAFTLFNNQLLALITSLFSFAWVLSPWMVSNLFDNLMVTFFGLLFLICLSRSFGKNVWINEIFQIIFLSLTGISHLTLSIVFFITAFHTNIVEFYENYWLGERKDLFVHLWRAIRVPLLSGIIVAVIWFPALGDFVNSLAYGLQAHGELGETRDPTFNWIIKRYNLTFNLPWILLGYLFVIWSNFYRGGNRSLRIVFAWSTVCFVFGIVLHPISFLNSRFFIMIPLFLLIPLAVYFLISKVGEQNYYMFTQKMLTIMISGIILSINLILNAYLMVNIPGLAIDYYRKIEFVNNYIETYNSPSPFIFLVENSGPLPETYSDLWLRIIRSQITDRGLVNSYLYFGTLDYLLQGDATPLDHKILPELAYPDEFLNSSQMWFDILEQDQILEKPQKTVFIIDSFNEDMWENYQFLPEVDTIGSGVLVINIPDDLPGQKSVGEKNQ